MVGTGKRLDVLAIGEPLMELNQRAGETVYLPGHGGDTSNCIIAATRQGARCGYLSAVGDDTFGRSFLELWDREEVDRSTVSVHPTAPTGIYFVTHGPKGHDFSYYRAGSAASLVRPEEIAAEAVAGARVLHASGISSAISTSACDAVFHAIRLAKDAGTLVSYDPNLRTRLWPLDRARAVIDATMRLADIALPGLDDAKALTGLDDPDRILRPVSRLRVRDGPAHAWQRGLPGGHARCKAADRRPQGEGGGRDRCRRHVRRLVPCRVSADGRRVQGCRLRQCRGGPGDAGLWGGGADAAPGRGRGVPGGIAG